VSLIWEDKISRILPAVVLHRVGFTAFVYSLL